MFATTTSFDKLYMAAAKAQLLLNAELWKKNFTFTKYSEMTGYLLLSWRNGIIAGKPEKLSISKNIRKSGGQYINIIKIILL